MPRQTLVWTTTKHSFVFVLTFGRSNSLITLTIEICTKLPLCTNPNTQVKVTSCCLVAELDTPGLEWRSPTTYSICIGCFYYKSKKYPNTVYKLPHRGLFDEKLAQCFDLTQGLHLVSLLDTFSDEDFVWGWSVVLVFHQNKSQQGNLYSSKFSCVQLYPSPVTIVSAMCM